VAPQDWRSSLESPCSALFCGPGTWSDGVPALLLCEPDRVLEAATPGDLPDLLDQVEAEQARGNFVAGYLSYEAGAAFGLSTHPPSSAIPLAWMAVYPPAHVRRFPLPDWAPGWQPPSIEVSGEHLNVSRAVYQSAIREIRELIAAGDTYQVNYTCHAKFSLDVRPSLLFLALVSSHPVPFAAYLNLGKAQILSLSPELFLSRRGEVLESRPMKGTHRRGRTQAEDQAFAHRLEASEKDRAELLMITDMVRNDLGSICRTGSVRWPALFRTEKYRSVWQMTSTVLGELPPEVRLRDVFRGTFPGASVTGAPKHRTMEIIRGLEPEPRGVYTGAIGLFMPGGDFTCNLAIRTLVHRQGRFDLGLGGGIVWDSRPDGEYEEALLKSRFLSDITPELRLFETMLLDDCREYVFEAEHLERLAGSARYWDFRFDGAPARRELADLAKRAVEVPAVARLELGAGGEMTLDSRDLPPAPAGPVRVVLAATATASGDRFLYHKTDRRALYDDERRVATESGYYEVCFCNERGHITEGAITNVFVRFGHEWVTPPILDGLLAGIWRAWFVRQTGAVERSFARAELSGADEIVIGNSVRGAVAVGEVWCDGCMVWPIRVELADK